jgi:hypothetical protein
MLTHGSSGWNKHAGRREHYAQNLPEVAERGKLLCLFAVIHGRRRWARSSRKKSPGGLGSVSKNSFRLRIYNLASLEYVIRGNDARSTYTIPTKTMRTGANLKMRASKALADRNPSEGQSRSARLDAKWVRMCEGVRKNDQAALDELFRLVKRMSWPPGFHQGADRAES